MRHKTTKTILFKLFTIILLCNCFCVYDAFSEWGKPCSSSNTDNCEDTNGDSHNDTIFHDHYNFEAKFRPDGFVIMDVMGGRVANLHSTYSPREGGDTEDHLYGGIKEKVDNEGDMNFDYARLYLDLLANGSTATLNIGSGRYTEHYDNRNNLNSLIPKYGISDIRVNENEAVLAGNNTDSGSEDTDGRKERAQAQMYCYQHFCSSIININGNLNLNDGSLKSSDNAPGCGSKINEGGCGNYGGLDVHGVINVGSNSTLTLGSSTSGNNAGRYVVSIFQVNLSDSATMDITGREFALADKTISGQKYQAWYKVADSISTHVASFTNLVWESDSELWGNDTTIQGKYIEVLNSNINSETNEKTSQYDKWTKATYFQTLDFGYTTTIKGLLSGFENSEYYKTQYTAPTIYGSGTLKLTLSDYVLTDITTRGAGYGSGNYYESTKGQFRILGRDTNNDNLITRNDISPDVEVTKNAKSFTINTNSYSMDTITLDGFSSGDTSVVLNLYQGYALNQGTLSTNFSNSDYVCNKYTNCVTTTTIYGQTWGSPRNYTILSNSEVSKLYLISAYGSNIRVVTTSTDGAGIFNIGLGQEKTFSYNDLHMSSLDVEEANTDGTTGGTGIVLSKGAHGLAGTAIKVGADSHTLEKINLNYNSYVIDNPNVGDDTGDVYDVYTRNMYLNNSALIFSSDTYTLKSTVDDENVLISGNETDANNTYITTRIGFNNSITTLNNATTELNTTTTALENATTERDNTKTVYDNAQTAYEEANTAYTTANTAYTTAQTNYNNAESALTTAQTNYNNAESALTTAQTNYNNAESALTTAQNNYNDNPTDENRTALKNATTERDNTKTALKNATTERDNTKTVYDNAQTTYDNAKSVLDSAEINHNTTSTNLARAITVRDEAKTNYDNAQTAYEEANTAYTTANTAYTTAQTNYENSKNDFNNAKDELPFYDDNSVVAFKATANKSAGENNNEVYSGLDIRNLKLGNENKYLTSIHLDKNAQNINENDSSNNITLYAGNDIYTHNLYLDGVLYLLQDYCSNGDEIIDESGNRKCNNNNFVRTLNYDSITLENNNYLLYGYNYEANKQYVYNFAGEDHTLNIDVGDHNTYNRYIIIGQNINTDTGNANGKNSLKQLNVFGSSILDLINVNEGDIGVQGYKNTVFVDNLYLDTDATLYINRSTRETAISGQTMEYMYFQDSLTDYYGAYNNGNLSDDSIYGYETYLNVNQCDGSTTDSNSKSFGCGTVNINIDVAQEDQLMFGFRKYDIDNDDKDALQNQIEDNKNTISELNQDITNNNNTIATNQSNIICYSDGCYTDDTPKEDEIGGKDYNLKDLIPLYSQEEYRISNEVVEPYNTAKDELDTANSIKKYYDQSANDGQYISNIQAEINKDETNETTDNAYNTLKEQYAQLENCKNNNNCYPNTKFEVDNDGLYTDETLKNIQTQYNDALQKYNNATTEEDKNYYNTLSEIYAETLVVMSYNTSKIKSTYYDGYDTINTNYTDATNTYIADEATICTSDTDPTTCELSNKYTNKINEVNNAIIELETQINNLQSEVQNDKKTITNLQAKINSLTNMLSGIGGFDADDVSGVKLGTDPVKETKLKRINILNNHIVEMNADTNTNTLANNGFLNFRGNELGYSTMILENNQYVLKDGKKIITATQEDANHALISYTTDYSSFNLDYDTFYRIYTILSIKGVDNEDNDINLYVQNDDGSYSYISYIEYIEKDNNNQIKVKYKNDILLDNNGQPVLDANGNIIRTDGAVIATRDISDNLGNIITKAGNVITNSDANASSAKLTRTEANVTETIRNTIAGNLPTDRNVTASLFKNNNVYQYADYVKYTEKDGKVVYKDNMVVDKNNNLILDANGYAFDTSGNIYNTRTGVICSTFASNCNDSIPTNDKNPLCKGYSVCLKSADAYTDNNGTYHPATCYGSDDGVTYASNNNCYINSRYKTSDYETIFSDGTKTSTISGAVCYNDNISYVNVNSGHKLDECFINYNSFDSSSHKAIVEYIGNGTYAENTPADIQDSHPDQLFDYIGTHTLVIDTDYDKRINIGRTKDITGAVVGEGGDYTLTNVIINPSKSLTAEGKVYDINDIYVAKNTTNNVANLGITLNTNAILKIKDFVSIDGQIVGANQNVGTGTITLDNAYYNNNKTIFGNDTYRINNIELKNSSYFVLDNNDNSYKNIYSNYIDIYDNSILRLSAEGQTTSAQDPIGLVLYSTIRGVGSKSRVEITDNITYDTTHTTFGTPNQYIGSLKVGRNVFEENTKLGLRNNAYIYSADIYGTLTMLTQDMLHYNTIILEEDKFSIYVTPSDNTRELYNFVGQNHNVILMKGYGYTEQQTQSGINDKTHTHDVIFGTKDNPLGSLTAYLSEYEYRLEFYNKDYYIGKLYLISTGYDFEPMKDSTVCYSNHDGVPLGRVKNGNCVVNEIPTERQITSDRGDIIYTGLARYSSQATRHIELEPIDTSRSSIYYVSLLNIEKVDGTDYINSDGQNQLNLYYYDSSSNSYVYNKAVKYINFTSANTGDQKVLTTTTSNDEYEVVYQDDVLVDRNGDLILDANGNIVCKDNKVRDPLTGKVLNGVVAKLGYTMNRPTNPDYKPVKELFRYTGGGTMQFSGHLVKNANSTTIFVSTQGGNNGLNKLYNFTDAFYENLTTSYSQKSNDEMFISLVDNKQIDAIQAGDVKRIRIRDDVDGRISYKNASIDYNDAKSIYTHFDIIDENPNLYLEISNRKLYLDQLETIARVRNLKVSDATLFTSNIIDQWMALSSYGTSTKKPYSQRVMTRNLQHTASFEDFWKAMTELTPDVTGMNTQFILQASMNAYTNINKRLVYFRLLRFINTESNHNIRYISQKDIKYYEDYYSKPYRENNAWFEGFYGDFHQEPLDRIFGYDFEYFGGTMGYDVRVTQNHIIGLSYTYNKIKGQDDNSSINNRDYLNSYAHNIDLYDMLYNKWFFLTLNAGGSYITYNQTRNINFSGFSETLKSNYHGYSYYAGAEIGANLLLYKSSNESHKMRMEIIGRNAATLGSFKNVNKNTSSYLLGSTDNFFMITPRITIHYTSLSIRKFKEDESKYAALSIKPEPYNVLDTSAGVSFTLNNLLTNNIHIQTILSGDYVYNVHRNRIEMEAGFIHGNGETFDVYGFEYTKPWEVDASATLNFIFLQRLEVGFTFTYTYANDYNGKLYRLTLLSSF